MLVIFRLPKPVLLSLVAVLLTLVACEPSKKDPYNSWGAYKGSAAGINYSSLTQIDTANVGQLEQTWLFHAGGADDEHHSQMQCNPIMLNGLLYGVSPDLKLFAVDAGTGELRWQFDPVDSIEGDKQMVFILNNCRGVSYWEEGDDKRVFYTAGSYLYALTADSGKLIRSFADQGRLDLHDGLDRDVADLFVTATTPPAIYKDMLLLGVRVDESAAAAPGHIRAFDARTGKRRWIFHTIPQPGEFGFESWDDSTAWERIGGANAWSGLTVDTERGLVFAATGSASYDFYGGDRLGNNLFANSILALDAETGKRRWHFQGIHHDVWDRDFSSPPILVTVRREGKTIDAVALTAKTGFIYVFDRETGTPLFDIEERSVPVNTDLDGEKLSPTQPFPTKPAPLMRQIMTEADINPFLSDSSRKAVQKAWSEYRHDHMFAAPSLQGTVVFPGLDGGSEWGGPSFDPETGVLYSNVNEMPWIIQAVRLKDNERKTETNLQAGTRLYRANCMTCHGPDRKGSGNFPSILHMEDNYSVESFDELLQSGRRMMPAFSRLSVAERNAIASFVLNRVEEQGKAFDKGVKPRNRSVSPYTITGYNRFLSPDGKPALSPPWGTLNAVDLSDGAYQWKIPLGTDTSVHAESATGLQNYGAGAVTAGGLIFIAATAEAKLRAFNKRTGELLWEHDLPTAAFATPAVYEWKGRQYVVIACGGGRFNTPSSDSYIAFALPQKKK